MYEVRLCPGTKKKPCGLWRLPGEPKWRRPGDLFKGQAEVGRGNLVLVDEVCPSCEAQAERIKA